MENTEQTLNEAEQAALQAAEGADVRFADGTQIDTSIEKEVEAEAVEPTGQDLDKQADEAVEAEVQAQQGAQESTEQTPDGEEELSEADQLKERIAELEAAQTEKEIFEQVGGRENYKAMTQWAETGLSEDEAAVFNEVMDSGNSRGMKFAVRALEAVYKMNVGHQGERIGGKPEAAESGYEGDQDFYADLQNPLYKQDSPAGAEFRQKVMKKMQKMSMNTSVDGWMHA